MPIFCLFPGALWKVILDYVYFCFIVDLLICPLYRLLQAQCVHSLCLFASLSVCLSLCVYVLELLDRVLLVLTGLEVAF